MFALFYFTLAHPHPEIPKVPPRGLWNIYGLLPMVQRTTYMELFWPLNIHMCRHWSGWARRDQT